MFLNKRVALRGQAGFTLIELLVTMLIVTVGLLGLAKLQAAAVSNTSVSRTRALMTYQAESLAGMIRANRGFWVTTGSLTSWPAFKVTAAGVVTNTGMDSSKSTCLNTTCTVAQLAYDDMYNWAKGFNDPTNPLAAFPNASASIVCVSASGGACGANPTTPSSYDITLSWNQKLVAVNRSGAGSTTTPVSMIMHVQP